MSKKYFITFFFYTPPVSVFNDALLQSSDTFVQLLILGDTFHFICYDVQIFTFDSRVSI